MTRLSRAQHALAGNDGQADGQAGIPFPFVAFPQQGLNLLAAGKIAPVDVSVLLVILKFRKNGQMTAWVTTAAIVKLTTMSETHVHRSLRRLTKAGLIERESCGRPDRADPANNTGYRFCIHALGVPPAALPRAAPNSDGEENLDFSESESSIPLQREKKRTTYCDISPREPGCDDVFPRKNPSFVSSSPSRKEFPKDADHEARREYWLNRVMALQLRISKSNPVFMTRQHARDAMDAASKRTRGGLRWIAWAIVSAEKRYDARKGRKPAEYWSYIDKTLCNFAQGIGTPDEGWPGESAMRPKPSTSCCDPDYNPRA